MRKMIRRTILVAMTVMLVSSAYGGEGTTGAEFLRIGVGARAVAMGEAYCAIPGDAFSTYWNPAGLVLLKDKELSLMYTSWFEDISHQFLGYSQPFGKRGALGISLLSLQITGVEERKTDTDDPISRFGANDYACILSYSHGIGKDLYLGSNLKFISSKIKDKSASGFGLDIGGLYIPTAIKGLSVGLNIQNITLAKITFIEEGDNLPFNVKAGAGYKMFNDNLKLALDLNLPSKGNLNYHFGTEYWIKDILALRAGYNSEIAGNKLGTFSLAEGLSVGFGVNLKPVQFDVAYVPYGDLGDTYRVSLLIRFGEIGKEAKKEE